MVRGWIRFALLSTALWSAAAAAQSSLRIGMRDDPDILDPSLSRTYVGTLVMTAMCDKLFDIDPKNGIVPVLATGYEWQDSTHLLIHLRSGVNFQDGEAMDAAAVNMGSSVMSTCPAASGAPRWGDGSCRGGRSADGAGGAEAAFSRRSSRC